MEQVDVNENVKYIAVPSTIVVSGKNTAIGIAGAFGIFMITSLITYAAIL